MKKIIFLFFLAIVNFVNCIPENLDLHLDNPSEVQLLKIQELLDIGKKIDEEHKVLIFLDSQIPVAFSSSTKTELQLDENLNDFGIKFERTFCEKRDISGLVSIESPSEEDYLLGFMKHLFVRRYFQKLIIKSLTKQYERCLQELQELIEISN